jgi:polysaccharide export outer membrane protein
MMALLCSGLTFLPITSSAQVASRNAAVTDTTAFAQPGDVVRLKIWREPDMSGDYTVDASGIATFPRLGALQVSRMGADSLQRLLVAEYARFLRNPSVEVILMRRVRVVGAVRTPGL